MKSCLERQSCDRIDIDQILSHEFLQGAQNLKDRWVEEYQACMEAERIQNLKKEEQK